MSNPIKKNNDPFLGILMLDTKFPRYVGDIANPDSFDFPVKKKIISGAYPEKIIRHTPDVLLPDFVKAAKEFEAEGAKLISTSCGFLTLFQKQLQAEVSIPVLTSSLFTFSKIQQNLREGKTVGILTIAASSLSPAHLAAANIPTSAPIASTEDGIEFTQAILENRPQLDYETSKKENVTAALELKNDNPDLGAILLECTNMPPYAKPISDATGLPVFSILDGLNTLWEKHC